MKSKILKLPNMIIHKSFSVEVKFKDIGALDQEKIKLQKLIDFLGNISKQKEVIHQISKGTLLTGPSGTGKTLLAEAIAGESGVPLFWVHGTDIECVSLEMGIVQIDELFRQADLMAPAIILIKEIEMIGFTKRNDSEPRASNEDNVLKHLLEKIESLDLATGILVLATSSKRELLDESLVQATYFDTSIKIDRPNQKARADIFEIHLKNVEPSTSLSFVELSKLTPGFTGADISELCASALSRAVRLNQKEISKEDFDMAIDQILGVAQVPQDQKKMVVEKNHLKSVYIAGKIILSWYLKYADPLLEATVVSIESAGYIAYEPIALSINLDQKLDQLCTLLGGRAAEATIFGQLSNYSARDFDKATEIAYSLIVLYALDELKNSDTDQEHETTNEEIDAKVKDLTEQEYERAKRLLLYYKNELLTIAKALEKEERLGKSEIEKLIGPVIK